MIEKMTYINPEMLKWARTMSNISLDNTLKYDRKTLESWENGEDYPTYAQLKQLANMYRKPVAVFFFPVPPNIKEISSSCRTLPTEIYSSFSKEIIRAFDDARVMQLNLYDLYDGINPSRKLITKIRFEKSAIKTIASELRILCEVSLTEQKRWSKVTESFEHWRDCFFSLGIYVFKAAFHDNAVSGFCLYDSEFPVIFVNNSLSFTRQIFTLFHEIFHIIQHTSGVDLLNDVSLNLYSQSSNADIERSCNAFAGEFLVPDEDFTHTIQNKAVSEEYIASWAQLYSVSREVILRKLLDRGRITSDQYAIKQLEYQNDYKRVIEVKKQGNETSGNYYNTQLSYKGKQYINLAFSSYYTQKINLTQLSQYLEMKIPSIRVIVAQKGWSSL